MSREVHVRFCKGLGVKFLGATYPPEIAALLEELRNQTCQIKYRLHKITQALP